MQASGDLELLLGPINVIHKPETRNPQERDPELVLPPSELVIVCPG